MTNKMTSKALGLLLDLRRNKRGFSVIELIQADLKSVAVDLVDLGKAHWCQVETKPEPIYRLKIGSKNRCTCRSRTKKGLFDENNPRE